MASRRCRCHPRLLKVQSDSQFDTLEYTNVSQYQQVLRCSNRGVTSETKEREGNRQIKEDHMSSLPFSFNEFIVSRARNVRKIEKQHDGNYCMHVINKVIT